MNAKPSLRTWPSVQTWLPRIVRLIVIAAGIGLAYLVDRTIFVAVAVLFVILSPFEKLYPRQKGQKIRRPGVTSDMAFALTSPVLQVASIIAVVIIGGLSFFWLPGLALRPFVAMLPTAALPFVGLVLFDFLGYWTHRWAHEVPFLWRFHAVHHSPEHMDWISGFRIHPFDGVLIAPPALFLLAAGFGAQVTGVLAVVQILLGLFFHANVRLRLRWLDKIIANPEFHHWHHANEADAIGHNYAAAIPMWDLIFGTFFMPKGGRRPRYYGVNEYMPDHMLGQLSHPCRGARKYLQLWRHPVIGFKVAKGGLSRLYVDVKKSTLRPTHTAVKVLSPPVWPPNPAELVGEQNHPSDLIDAEDGRFLYHYVAHEQPSSNPLSGV